MMKKTRKTGYHHGDLRAALIERAAIVIEEDGIEALSLRSLAKDLGVSHGAPNRHFKNKLDLLSALAADGYQKLIEATFAAAGDVKTEDPWVRLNALAKGFMRWALSNRSSFLAITHPDVGRYASDDLIAATHRFQSTVREYVRAAQDDGRYPEITTEIVALFTNAVPFGAVMIMMSPVFEKKFIPEDQEHLIEQIAELIVPIRNRST